MPCALITGTSSGFGRGVAERLHALGWDVLGTVRNAARSAGLTFETTELDVTDQVAVESLGQEVMSRWGRLDALVNNAGCIINGPVEELTPDELRHQLDVNAVGAASVTRGARQGIEWTGSPRRPHRAIGVPD